MPEEIGLFDAIGTMRAMRRLKPDPVPEGLIRRVIEAGTRGPNGGNLQAWGFLVVRDPETKQFVKERYLAAFRRYIKAGMQAVADGTFVIPEEELNRRARMSQAGMHLAENLADVPVLLFACIDSTSAFKVDDYPGDLRGLCASIYPAVQNILLACRGLGLGAVLTTLHLLYEDEIKERLGIPPHIHTAAMIPIGYPKGRFGPVIRRSVDDVTYWERWGE